MIGEKIREQRKKNNLTQTELGKRLGVVKQTISNWENEISQPSNEALTAMANLFDVSIDYLLGYTRKEISDNDLEWRYPLLSNRLGNILKKYRQETALSIESICDTLQISKKTYEQLEDGTYTPSLKLIKKISDQTGYSLDFLTGAIDSDQIKKADDFEDTYIFECDHVFKSRFEAFCLKNGITIDNVEKKLSLSAKEFNDIKFNRMPTLSELLKISYASNLSIDYLIGKSDNTLNNLSDDEVELILNYRDCKETYKKNLLKRSSELSIASIDLDSKESVAADSESKSTGKSLA